MNETTNTTEWITLRQAGEVHGVSRQTVLAWIKKGWILSGTRVGWQFVVDRAEIVAYVPRRGGYKNIEQTAYLLCLGGRTLPAPPPPTNFDIDIGLVLEPSGKRLSKGQFDGGSGLL